MWTDDDCKFISDMAYLKDLEEAVFDHAILYGRHTLSYPHGVSVEDKLRNSMSCAAKRAAFGEWVA